LFRKYGVAQSLLRYNRGNKHPNRKETMRHLIYEHLNYRSFLKAFLEVKKDQGVSLRSIVKRGKIGSHSFLKAVVEGERNLTVRSTEKVCAALGLDGNEREYFLALVKLEHGAEADKDKAWNDLRKLLIKSKEVRVHDVGMYSHWLHGVVFSMATVANIEFTAENLFKMLGGIASAEDIQKSMDFLISRTWLVYDEGLKRYKQSLVKFEVIEDIRRIDVQRNHRHFLDLAKHRLNDDVDEREYQGLTIAVPKNRLPQLKQRLRKFMDEIDDDIGGMSDFDTLIRVQCCIFKLTK
jgi:uncharacterized protein (TIGR02147 family)